MTARGGRAVALSVLVFGLGVAGVIAGAGHAALASDTTRVTALQQPASAPIALAAPPFVPASGVESTSSRALSMDAVRVPPIEAMSPVAGLDFGHGLQLEPALLVADALGLAALAYVVRRRWMPPSS